MTRLRDPRPDHVTWESNFCRYLHGFSGAGPSIIRGIQRGNQQNSSEMREAEAGARKERTDEYRTFQGRRNEASVNPTHIAIQSIQSHSRGSFRSSKSCTKSLYGNHSDASKLLRQTLWSSINNRGNETEITWKHSNQKFQKKETFKPHDLLFLAVANQFASSNQIFSTVAWKRQPSIWFIGV